MFPDTRAAFSLYTVNVRPLTSRRALTDLVCNPNPNPTRSAFSAGAILATALFLILFESTHYIATGWDDEVEVNW